MASATLRRSWNRLRRSLVGTPVGFVYAPGYRVDLGGSPYDPERAERILTFLVDAGLIGQESLLRPRRASLNDLRLGHTAAYLEALRHPRTLTEILGVDVRDEVYQLALQSQRLGVGGTLLATRHALRQNRTAVNLGGGFHHARPEGGRGFCIFNDVTVAIRRARGDGFEDQILVVDLDLHDGNGTRAAFAEDPSVFTFSIHNQTWEDEPALGSLSIELSGEVEETDYLEALRTHLPGLLQELRPQLVYYLAGTDPAIDDRLGNWKVTAAGMLERDRFVVSQVRRLREDTPLVVLLAGGYGKETWRYSARFFAWLLTGRQPPEPPTTKELTLRNLRNAARLLGKSKAKTELGDDIFSLSDEDIHGELGRDAKQSRLLGRFTPHEVELLLEWTGFMDRLRDKGFRDTVLDLDLENPTGHTIRLFCDSHRAELLMELRLRIDRQTLPGMELLEIAWLLLQNPRASFASRGGALPGQDHPGLGLLNDVMALLILVCDELLLDGILFVPSHYHLAATGKKYLRFLQPEDEARFRALQQAAESLPLGEASQAIDEGRLTDIKTGQTIAWSPTTMVLPISDRLHDLVEGVEFEKKVEEAAQDLRFALR
jgi:acetoin utilization deacetylase AcuC-like enzyme